jgi:hypothetical protein
VHNLILGTRFILRRLSGLSVRGLSNGVGTFDRLTERKGRGWLHDRFELSREYSCEILGTLGVFGYITKRLVVLVMRSVKLLLLPPPNGYKAYGFTSSTLDGHLRHCVDYLGQRYIVD